MMEAEHIQILQMALDTFASTVHDSFGERVLQDVFVPSSECMGRMIQMEDENTHIIFEIQNTLEETQEAGKAIESGWEESGECMGRMIQKEDESSKSIIENNKSLEETHAPSDTKESGEEGL